VQNILLANLQREIVADNDKALKKLRIRTLDDWRRVGSEEQKKLGSDVITTLNNAQIYRTLETQVASKANDSLMAFQNSHNNLKTIAHALATNITASETRQMTLLSAYDTSILILKDYTRR
jgi:hypothetical protein